MGKKIRRFFWNLQNLNLCLPDFLFVVNSLHNICKLSAVSVIIELQQQLCYSCLGNIICAFVLKFSSQLFVHPSRSVRMQCFFLKNVFYLCVRFFSLSSEQVINLVLRATKMQHKTLISLRSIASTFVD